jgi:putative ABC transport system substrate-binding protein
MMRATGGTTTSADPSPDELNQDLRTVIVAPMTTAGRALVGWSAKHHNRPPASPGDVRNEAAELQDSLDGLQPVAQERGAVGLTISRLTLVVAVLCLAAPLAAMAQAGRVRIGYLTAGDEARNPRNAAFRQRLRELGYVEGQDVTLEIRAAAGKLDRLPGLAAELVRLKVDVIVANNSPAIDAARKATTSIPIVMSAATDPVATGFVTSLARPGGNITGLTIQSPDLSAKTLQLLKEAVPNLSRVTVLLDPGFPGGRRWLSELETAAPALVVQLQVVEVRSPSDLEGAFAAATKNRAGAVLSVAGSIGFLHRAQIADLAVKRRLPTVGGLPEYAEAGWLMGFGARFIDQDRRAADFVDRILKGAKPADLPIEQPTKFYLAINLKTAKALGLSIPPPLLLRADQLIQ